MYVPKTRLPETPETRTIAPPASQDGLVLLDGQDLPISAVRTLVVEDEETLRELFARVLHGAGYEVTCVHSASEAIQCLENAEFDIVLGDVHLPDKSGMELLDEILARLPDMPVILITGNGNVEMARQALEHGAVDFLTKPLQVSELPIIIERNLARQAVHHRRMQQFRQALHTSNESILDALLSALNTRDTETEGHSERVTAYTIEMAEMLGVDARTMHTIERGALLHDIGKIGIPDGILLKPGPLTPEEWVEMRKHPEIGYQMCARIAMLKDAAQIVLHHHEAWDGSGYPHKLVGEAIPLGARIFAVADTFDAMTSDRPYRAALPFQTAVGEIESKAGSQFDPQVVRVFLQVRAARWDALRDLAQQIAA